MTLKRYGAGETGAGGKPLPFARAVEADGWLYVSGQVAMENGEIVPGGIVEQTHKTMANVIAILTEPDTGWRMSCASASGWTTPATSGASTASTLSISRTTTRRPAPASSPP